MNIRYLVWKCIKQSMLNAFDLANMSKWWGGGWEYLTKAFRLRVRPFVFQTIKMHTTRLEEKQYTLN